MHDAQRQEEVGGSLGARSRLASARGPLSLGNYARLIFTEALAERFSRP